MLEGAEDGHEQVEAPAAQHDDDVAGVDGSFGEHVGEAVGQFGELAVGHLSALVRLTQQAQGDPIAVAVCDVAVDRLVGDVQAAAGEAVEL